MYLLLPFSLIYGLVVFVRNFLYDARAFKQFPLGAKVISVGNITWGGTGKTPVTAFIAELLKKENRRAAILIRGYGKDEPKLFSQLSPGTPVFVGRDRVKTGRDAADNHLADTVILDDGFQHRRLKRDLDIVCIDGVNPFGNGFLIPAGSRREGMSSLKRADIFLITKADLVRDKSRLLALEDKLKSINKKAVIARAIHRPLCFQRISTDEKVGVDQLKDKELVLVSAIGSPHSFEKTIMRLGLKINRHFIFRDHYWYRKNDLQNISDYCRKNGLCTVVTTEKDAIKLNSVKLDPEFLVLQVKLEIIENEEGFRNRLFGIYSH